MSATILAERHALNEAAKAIARELGRVDHFDTRNDLANCLLTLTRMYREREDVSVCSDSSSVVEVKRL